MQFANFKKNCLKFVKIENKLMRTSSRKYYLLLQLATKIWCNLESKCQRSVRVNHTDQFYVRVNTPGFACVLFSTCVEEQPVALIQEQIANS